MPSMNVVGRQRKVCWKSTTG
ncbi:hypothetical protein AZE42_05536 [Rhizopogon vesiculosus]|uniref:Uncharacterized protein n=1 Tax=Rhizopogon vesiculosus TaxID=180088 RepID=A0A1J8RAW7_9AGAM|nr:hypothetical protein AZE42_05536 [Rhizopogon vesiculosus]